MHADLKYVESLEMAIDELKSKKAEFSDIYDVILHNCVSKDVMCSYFQSLSDLDALAELQCMYLHKVKECDCLAQRLSKQTDSVKSVHKANVSEGLSKPVLHRLYLTQRRKLLQLKSNQSKDKVLPNNSQVKAKKTQVEVHPRIPSVSNKKKSITACKDSLNSRTLNANAVCATCNKCLVDSYHFACVTKMLNDVHARTKKPTVVPISTRKPKSQVNKSMATPNKKKFVPILGYGDLVQGNVTISMVYYVEGLNHNLFSVGQFCDTDLEVAFRKSTCFVRDLQGNDLLTGNVTINRVYYVEGLNHNLFSVGQFCDADLEVAFRKSTCFVRDLQGNDLLTDNRGSDLYTISLQESTSLTPLCLMAKASPTQAWLWHQRLSHLNFNYINLLSKKDIMIGLPKLKYVKDQLCSSC
nr:retrovirus-related Pol polyprotein from transposon TNT 1-94 [Tanacetum cinerariifolium]